MARKFQYYRAAELATRLGICRASVWNWTRKGILPKPHRLGPRVTAWRADEIETALAKLENETAAES